MMNGNQVLCNQTWKNLPLKKRRAYLVDSSLTNDENHTKILKISHSHGDSHSFYVPTPPSSPNVQSYAYFSGNSTQFLPQQYFDHYRSLPDQQQQQQQQQYYAYPIVEDKSKPMYYNVDERVRRPFQGNSSTFTARCLTPDDSSSNSSNIERSLVDSIEEHFARSLAKFQPSNDNEHFSKYHQHHHHRHHQITGSVVDDHFARALGTNTWERLKDRS